MEKRRRRGTNQETTTWLDWHVKLPPLPNVREKCWSLTEVWAQQQQQQQDMVNVVSSTFTVVIHITCHHPPQETTMNIQTYICIYIYINISEWSVCVGRHHGLWLSSTFLIWERETLRLSVWVNVWISLAAAAASDESTCVHTHTTVYTQHDYWLYGHS